jgi:hypothetical protein
MFERHISNFLRAFQRHGNHPNWSLHAKGMACEQNTQTYVKFCAKKFLGGNLESMCVVAHEKKG